MRCRTKIAAILAAIGIIVFGLAAPGSADEQDEDSIIVTPHNVELNATDYIPAGSDPTSEPDPNCTWSLTITDDFERAMYTTGRPGRDAFSLYETSANMTNGDRIELEAGGSFILDSHRAYTPTGRWWNKSCTKPDSEEFDYSQDIPEGEPVTIPELMLQAIGEIEPEEPPTQTDPEGAVKLVQAPTIFSIPETYWTQRTNTVTAGRVTVTAFLDPTQSFWNTGEPDTNILICEGAGKPYEKRTDHTTYPCQHTYKWAPPPGETYTLETTAVFEVTGTTNAPETIDSETYPDLEITATNPIEIGESHAVVVGSDG